MTGATSLSMDLISQLEVSTFLADQRKKKKKKKDDVTNFGSPTGLIAYANHDSNVIYS